MLLLTFQSCENRNLEHVFFQDRHFLFVEMDILILERNAISMIPVKPIGDHEDVVQRADRYFLRRCVRVMSSGKKTEVLLF